MEIAIMANQRWINPVAWPACFSFAKVLPFGGRRLKAEAVVWNLGCNPQIPDTPGSKKPVYTRSVTPFLLLVGGLMVSSNTCFCCCKNQSHDRVRCCSLRHVMCMNWYMNVLWLTTRFIIMLHCQTHNNFQFAAFTELPSHKDQKMQVVSTFCTCLFHLQADDCCTINWRAHVYMHDGWKHP